MHGKKSVPQLPRIPEERFENSRGRSKFPSITDTDKKPRGSLKKTDSTKKQSKKSLAGISSMTGDSDAVPSVNRMTEAIRNMQQRNLYKVVYITVYYWLALNDHFRLLFLEKSSDVIFFTFTIIFVSKCPKVIKFSLFRIWYLPQVNSRGWLFRKVLLYSWYCCKSDYTLLLIRNWRVHFHRAEFLKSDNDRPYDWCCNGI